MTSPAPEDDVRSTSNFPWLLLAFLPSLLLHGVAFASLASGTSGRTAAVNPPSEMSFVVTPPAQEAPQLPEPEPEPEPEKAMEPVPALAKPAQPAREAPVPVAKPPAPLDLRGLTLSNGAGSFAMPAGNALPLDRPIGTGRVQDVEATRSASVAPPPAAPALVPFDSLGTRPKPPSLEAALRQNYPADARRRSIGGSATVVARIDRDGVARGPSVVSETFAGFGDACRRTLAGSRWSPPLDDTGRAVSTQIRYTCHFKVSP